MVSSWFNIFQCSTSVFEVFSLLSQKRKDTTHQPDNLEMMLRDTEGLARLPLVHVVHVHGARETHHNGTHETLPGFFDGRKAF